MSRRCDSRRTASCAFASLSTLACQRIPVHWLEGFGSQYDWNMESMGSSKRIIGSICPNDQKSSSLYVFLNAMSPLSSWVTHVNARVSHTLSEPHAFISDQQAPRTGGNRTTYNCKSEPYDLAKHGLGYIVCCSNGCIPCKGK